MMRTALLTPLAPLTLRRYAEILDAAEAASLGLSDMAPSLAAVATSHYQWARGAMARAIDVRERRLRELSQRVRAAQLYITPGARAKMRQHTTNDVVRDTPLPEFNINLASLLNLFQPVRPLRPARSGVKKVQVRV